MLKMWVLCPNFFGKDFPNKGGGEVGKASSAPYPALYISFTIRVHH